VSDELLYSDALNLYIVTCLQLTVTGLVFVNDISVATQAETFAELELPDTVSTLFETWHFQDCRMCLSTA